MLTPPAMMQPHAPGAAENRIYEVAIIGAGPIGIELAVYLKRAGVDYIHFDAKQIADTMSWWPRNTNFFSTTERLAIAGIPIQNNHQQRITGEDYMAYLRAVVEQFDLPVHTYEPVTALKRCDDGFALETGPLTGPRHYRARRVVLAIGDMHYPNRLNVPGEDLPQVSHYFRDPHDYFRRRLLIVGGRNSAVEAALRCWRAGVQVTMSYRRSWFDTERVKDWLLPDLKTQIDTGIIQFLPATTVVKIEPGRVLLARCENAKPTQDQFWHDTDFVLLSTGFRGEQRLLRMAGVRLEGSDLVPVYNPETMESNVPGLYLAGTVAAGVQQRYSLFIENSHEHAIKIATQMTGRMPTRTGDIEARNYQLALERIQDN